MEYWITKYKIDEVKNRKVKLENLRLKHNASEYKLNKLKLQTHFTYGKRKH